MDALLQCICTCTLATSHRLRRTLVGEHQAQRPNHAYTSAAINLTGVKLVYQEACLPVAIRQSESSPDRDEASIGKSLRFLIEASTQQVGESQFDLASFLKNFQLSLSCSCIPFATESAEHAGDFHVLHGRRLRYSSLPQTCRTKSSRSPQRSSGRSTAAKCPPYTRVSFHTPDPEKFND